MRNSIDVETFSARWQSYEGAIETARYHYLEARFLARQWAKMEGEPTDKQYAQAIKWHAARHLGHAYAIKARRLLEKRKCPAKTT